MKIKGRDILSRLVAIVAFALISVMQNGTSANAQNGINSPYSRYGFGIISDRSMGFNKGMAGVAQGFRGGSIVNVGNPASYSAVDSITALFDFGLSLSNGNYKMGEIQQNAKNSSLDYIALHFRAAQGLGVAVGVLPFSNIKYDFESTSTTINGSKEITSSSTYTGDGGLHQVFFGMGWRPFRPISIGANISYLYGDYAHISTTSFSDASIFSNVRSYVADLSTYALDLGIQYVQPVSKSSTLTFGATYGFGHDISNRAKRISSRINASQLQASSDTITLNDAFQLPHTIAFGLAYKYLDKWTVGADCEIQKWGDCKFPVTVDEGGKDEFVSRKGQLNDRIKISLGGTLLPDAYSSSLFNRIQYKAGFYYSKSYANADFTGTLSDKPYEYGLSAGVSIPIDNQNAWRMRPRINLTAQWVHTNIPYADNIAFSQTGNVMKRELVENYLRLCIGLTFNEIWFNKWKVQ